MSALENDYLWKSARVSSQSDQSTGPSVLPPFSQKFSVDEKLKLSQDNFKLSIEDFLKHKDTTPLSQLTATPHFPTPHVLAQFASKAYRDYEKGETDAQYETRLALPDGWKLLTMASNSRNSNGYFGAAYWHPEHQQVVVAHRGTDPKNLGALWADLNGVLRSHYVPQMESASTFAHKVVEVLQAVSQRKGVNFEMFFTGHSLGGWLAQITTFTTEYLKIEGNIFLKNDDVQDCYHPHTVVFDSPGCKDMLSKMTDRFDVRLEGRSIDIEPLDITSYLSAPNRINTCNSHLGTVYRIFTDLSDMGRPIQHTALYNLATHSMEKIVEAFDPQTGQVHKDEQGQLKVQVVIDWPICAGVTGGKEYKKFFKWAEHLNNYHPDIKDVSVHHSSYNLIRYQTKLYDERVNNFSIFSEEEQEFLHCYLWLRQWPELFKPKELFSVMKDNQAQEGAEKMLQSFEIEKHKIRSTDAIALQAFIPYVKRLLQLFPEVKENTKRALSSYEVRNRVYQFETRRYVEQINRSPLEFNFDSLSLREFLESEQQKVLNLQMSKGDEWTGLIKVHQVLQKTGCITEGQYIVLKLEHFLALNRWMDFSKMMQSTVTPCLLLIACEENRQLDEETKDVIRTLFDTIEQKQIIKFIFITPSERSTVDFLRHIGRKILRKGFLSRNEQLSWCDLTNSSQEKLLEKSVKFQDAKISLNELMSAECPAAKFFSLSDLLAERELQIADPVTVSNGYNESYYIGRTFCIRRAIKQDIFKDEDVIYSHVYLARSEKEYKQLCQLNPKSNVHWLAEGKTGKLYWLQSQGRLEIVRRYIDSDISHTYTDGDLVELLGQAQHQRVMLISDIAGMGKSTVLTRVSKIIKRTSPSKWVARIDLNDHTAVLKALKEELKLLKQGQINSKKVIEFVSEKLLKLKPGLEMELFKQGCEQKQKVRIVIMLDGFDEISPHYKECVIGLLQALRQTAVEQLWVTTRPNLRDELEEELQQLSYTLEPFSKRGQVEFLTKFWRLKDWFTELEEKTKEIEKNKLEIYAKHLIRNLANSISDKDRVFTGIPLQTRMLAEAFDEEVKTFCMSSESIPDLPLKLDLLELYERFIGRKYYLYQEEKCQENMDNVGAMEKSERDLKTVRQEHQLLAIKVLFTEEQVALLQNNNQCTFKGEELTRIGLAELSREGQPRFIHRTIAEYFVATFFVNSTSQKVQDFILKDIFLKEEYQVIRVFIDGLLSRSKPSEEMSIQYGTRIHDLGNDCLLHLAAFEGNANIIKFVLESARAGGHRDKVTGLLLGQDEEERTAWYQAAASGELEVLDIISVWAKNNLTREEIKNKLLLATDIYGDATWYLAARGGNQDVVQKIWDFAKDNLTAEEIKNKLLLSTDRGQNTAWHLAAKGSNQDVPQKIWDFAKDILTAEEIKNEWLLATDVVGNTAWHLAVEEGNQDVLQKTRDFAKDHLTAEEIKSKLLLTTDRDQNTAWHLAAKGSNQDVLQKIWEFAKDILTAEEIKNEWLLATDVVGNTAWHLAVEGGNQDVLQKIWDFAKDHLTAEEIKNMFFFARDGYGNPVWHFATHERNQDVLQKIWYFAKKNLTAEEIKNMLVLSTDSRGNTAWHMAAYWNNQDILQKIWDFAKDNLTVDLIKNMLVLSTDSDGNTAWHLAAGEGNPDILQKMWDFAKDNLTAEEIKNKLLLSTDRDKNTAWHLAAKGSNQDVLQKIWDFAKDILTEEEIKNNLLLATDRYQNTALRLAAKGANPDVMQKIWGFAKDYLTAEEIKSKLFLATDRYLDAAWHLAAL